VRTLRPVSAELPSALSAASIPPPVLEVLDGLRLKGFQAFLVGGCVRDMLRGQHPKDFDLATSARPEEVQRCFRKVIPTGIEHGTVTVLVQGHHVEVTTFRAEADYVDGRRPTKVEFHTDIEADLSRRDFTINAMAYDLRRLVDPFGGQVDLAARTVRCVGKAIDRFTEDGLRALRAVRFSAVLGFSLDPDTQAAIAPTRHVFRKVAFERVQEELRKILLSPGAARGLSLLDVTGLLEDAVPEAKGAPFDAVVNAPVDEAARLAVLLAHAATPRTALQRLKLPTKVIERTLELIAGAHPPAPDASPRAFRLWLRGVGREPEQIAQALGVAGALGAPIDALAPRVAAVRGDPLTVKDLALTGADLTALLGNPGPQVGALQRHLLELVLETPAENTAERLSNAARQWCAQVADIPR